MVAPSQTLSNHEYHLLRSIAIKIVREVEAPLSAKLRAATACALSASAGKEAGISAASTPQR